MDQSVLELQSLTLNRGRRRIMTDVDLIVRNGELVVIRGDNGSGKTSFFRALLGLLPVESGVIRLCGRTVGSTAWKTHRSSAAWVPQEGVLHRFPIAAMEAVEVGLAGQSLSRREIKQRVENALESAGAAHLAGRCFHRLSGGERQRVSIARCLAQGAELLLLDEPATALDAESRRRLVNLTESLSDQGKTLIVATHDDGLFSPGRWRECRLEGGRLC